MTKLIGQYTVDGVSAINMNTLNARTNNFIWYVRSTLDYGIDVKWVLNDTTYIELYNTVRFRYVWGDKTEARSFDTSFIIADVEQSIIGVSSNKHLLWMREGWLKLDIDSLFIDRKIKLEASKGSGSYVQMGLIPFAVGRGISLGAAYDSSGFLGFKSDFAIDQYAPAFLLYYNTSANKYNMSLYGATLKNQQAAIDDTFNLVVNGVKQSSISSDMQQSYLIAWDHKLNNMCDGHVAIESYIVYLAAPNQTVEFLRDTDVFLATIGFACEGLYTRWNWGFEGAFNLGELLLKAKDRNTFSIVKNEDGFLVERYSKVYDRDSRLATASFAQATVVNNGYVERSAKTKDMNGKNIGPGLYNAFDRFRPSQKRKFEGYFFVADGMYDVIPTVLQLAFGAGYASGDFHKKLDANVATDFHCMNQKFSGFIPLQSEYAGKRIRHIVALNQGLPRCDNSDSDKIRETNFINNVQAVTIQDLTNLAFVGTRVLWHPAALKDHGLELSANLVNYWVPEPVLVENSAGKSFLARDLLGTEISTEFSWLIRKKIKCAGYAGVFLPGPFYYDNCGKIINDLKVPSGTDVGFIGNVAVTYEF